MSALWSVLGVFAPHETVAARLAALDDATLRGVCAEFLKQRAALVASLRVNHSTSDQIFDDVAEHVLRGGEKAATAALAGHPALPERGSWSLLTKYTLNEVFTAALKKRFGPISSPS